MAVLEHEPSSSPESAIDQHREGGLASRTRKIVNSARVSVALLVASIASGMTAPDRPSPDDGQSNTVVRTVQETFAVPLVLASTPPEDVATDSVDLIELNHYYDKDGRLVFDQIIFFDWCHYDSRFHVRAWRMVKVPSQIPTKRWETGDYITIWYDGDVLRKVRCADVRESWTQYDPEVLEREYLPEKQRRELTRLMVK